MSRRTQNGQTLPLEISGSQNVSHFHCTKKANVETLVDPNEEELFFGPMEDILIDHERPNERLTSLELEAQLFNDFQIPQRLPPPSFTSHLDNFTLPKLDRRTLLEAENAHRNNKYPKNHIKVLQSCIMRKKLNHPSSSSTQNKSQKIIITNFSTIKTTTTTTTTTNTLNKSSISNNNHNHHHHNNNLLTDGPLLLLNKKNSSRPNSSSSNKILRNLTLTRPTGCVSSKFSKNKK